ASSAVSVASGATFDLNGNNATIGALTGSGTVTNNAAGTGTATLTTNSGSLNIFAGSIQDGPTAKTAFTLVGGTTVILTGANTYTGPTLINGGLAVGNNGTTGSLAAG